MDGSQKKSGTIPLLSSRHTGLWNVLILPYMHMFSYVHLEPFYWKKVATTHPHTSLLAQICPKLAALVHSTRNQRT